MVTITTDRTGHAVPATWQDDFAQRIPYFSRAFGKRFRFFRPDMREELVQEGLAQAAVIYSSDYARHGSLTAKPHQIARTVASRVKQGRSSTRPPGRNADPCDHSFRVNGPKRSPDVLEALDYAAWSSHDDPEWCVDLLDWIESLPDRLRHYATLAYCGKSNAEIREAMGVGTTMITRYRRMIREMWAEAVA